MVILELSIASKSQAIPVFAKKCNTLPAEQPWWNTKSTKDIKN